VNRSLRVNRYMGGNVCYFLQPAPLQGKPKLELESNDADEKLA